MMGAVRHDNSCYQWHGNAATMKLSSDIKGEKSTLQLQQVASNTMMIVG
jgi:hypothetical protein